MCRLSIWVIIVLLCGHAFAERKEELTLKQIISVAVSRIETVKLQEMRTQQAQERLKQLESRFYPKVSFLIDYTRIHQPTITTDTTAPFSQLDQYDGKLTLTMSSIQGLREYYGHKVASLDILVQKDLEENVKRLLTIDIFSAFFKLQSARAELANLELLLKASQIREREVVRFVNLGRSQESDRYQQKTLVATVNASLIQAQGAVNAAENFLRAMAGLEDDATISQDVSSLPDSLLPFSEFLLGLENRSDIASLRTQIVLSQNLIEVAKADYWPSLDLKANIHAFRSGILATSWWDVGVSLTIPIFDGFSTPSAVRSSHIALRQNEYSMLWAKRVAAKEVRAVYDDAQRIFVSLPALKAAYDEASKYYDQVRKDYERKLVNNLDVTVALNQLYTVKRSYDQNLNEFKLLYQTLLAISGRDR